MLEEDFQAEVNESTSLKRIIIPCVLAYSTVIEA